MNKQATLDASQYPDYAYSHRAPVWWGMVGLVAVEGTVFASLIASFFYLSIHQPQWPPCQPPS